MTDRIKQIEFEKALTSFIDKSFVDTSKRTQQSHQDLISKADVKSKEELKKLNGALNVNKPVLPKDEEQKSSDDNNTTETFRGLVELMYGNVKAEMNSEAMLSDFNTKFGQLSLKKSAVTLTKQKDLLAQQLKLDAKIQKESSILGTITLVSTIFAIASGVFLLAEMGFGALMGAAAEEEVVGEAAETGIKEGVEGALEQGASRSSAEAVEGGIEEAAEAEPVEEMEAAGVSPEEMDEVLEGAAAPEEQGAAPEAQAENAPKSSWKEWCKNLFKKNSYTTKFTSFAGTVTATAGPALEAYFNVLLSTQHKEMAKIQEAGGTSSAEMKKMTTVYSYFQKALQRQTGIIQEQTSQTGDVLETAADLFKGEKTISSLLAQAV